MWKSILNIWVEFELDVSQPHFVVVWLRPDSQNVDAIFLKK
jgi:hypothetical protein